MVSAAPIMVANGRPSEPAVLANVITRPKVHSARETCKIKARLPRCDQAKTFPAAKRVFFPRTEGAHCREKESVVER